MIIKADSSFKEVNIEYILDVYSKDIKQYVSLFSDCSLKARATAED